jgi:hypothetical protein
MKKVYQRSRLNHFFLIFLIFFDFLLFKITLSLVESNHFFFAILVFLGFLISFRATVHSFLTIERKVILSKDGIKIIQLFFSKEFKWNEIREFGRYMNQTSLFGKLIGKESYWNYFIKATHYGDKRIHIEDDKFSQVHEIISTIFQRAKNANFVSIINTSKIPFKENLEKTGWNKKDSL